MISDDKINALKKAYGEAYEKVKPHLDAHGYCSFENLAIKGTPYAGVNYDDAGFKYDQIDNRNPFGSWKWRPKSLRGFEDNNGWIRVDQRLPEDEDMIVICCDGEYVHGAVVRGLTYKILHISHPNFYSHWKMHEEVKPPLF